MYMSATEALANIGKLAEMLKQYREGRAPFPFNDQLTALVTPTIHPVGEELDAARWRALVGFIVAHSRADAGIEELPAHYAEIDKRGEELCVAAPTSIEEFVKYMDTLFGTSVAPPVSEAKEDPTEAPGDPS